MRSDGAHKSDLVDLTLRQHMITSRAVLVSNDGTEARAKWLPLSQCEVEMTNRSQGIVTVTLPEWLAHEKGLI